MSYDPTQWAPQPPEQQPSQGQPPAGTPPYGQPQQPPATPPAYGQSNPNWAPTQQAQPPATPPSYGQSNPNWAPTQQPAAPPSYGQSNPNWAPTQQAQQPAAPSTAYGQSNPGLPPAAPPPAYGQSNPSLPPYGQAPQAPADPGAYNQYAPQPPVDPYAPQPPVDPYATPAPGQPYQPGMPPAYAPGVPPKKSPLKAILIVVIIIVLLGAGGGTWLYIASRPQPVITVTSKYTSSALPAGSSSTTFTVTGKDFSGNSAITFLLDNSPVPGAQTTQSDSNGNVTATLTVTDAWTAGNHTITAKDAGGYLTKVGKQITIVAQGQAGTPGPNGAPTDSASGTINVTVSTGGGTEQTVLTVTGSATGGTVCGTNADGQPHTTSGTTNGLAYTETRVVTCQGTYKSGKIDYTETESTDKITFDNGAVCNIDAPFVDAHLVGTFSSATSISGTFTEDQTTLTCSVDGSTQSQNVDAQSGTWTGISSMQ